MSTLVSDVSIVSKSVQVAIDTSVKVSSKCRAGAQVGGWCEYLVNIV